MVVGSIPITGVTDYEAAIKTLRTMDSRQTVVFGENPIILPKAGFSGFSHISIYA